MVRIGVVILNYLAHEATVQCVEDFKKQDRTGVELRIVIVDNHSPNDSEAILKSRFGQDEDVTVISADRNLGFAKGNNLGYSKLLEYMTPDYVIFSNDDILLPQAGLFEWIQKCDCAYRFGMLGPDVFSVSGQFHQSPMPNYSTDLNACKGKLKIMRRSYLKMRIKRLLGIQKRRTPVPVIQDSPGYDQADSSLTLQGSFQIMSKRYLEQYGTPYDAGTFLYMEEYIVKLRCDQKGLPMVYSPDYRVNHLQALSTNLINDTPLKKDIFRTKHHIRSLKRYIALLKG